MSDKNDLMKDGVKEVAKKGSDLFDGIEKNLPNTPFDKAGKSVGKKICKGIDKIVDSLF
ncbi:hypothetical protein MWH25_04840 [Natroniella acetigena]|uniref:hypothetical protein n=1 Tax=Natroniella acetigena TaxID=52004 RepID=UPI00200B3D81|nr:hypothetical protein [Natroniella acetigena]MCK8827073.1 hypothetical protein [Natroniella acetigena]